MKLGGGKPVVYPSAAASVTAVAGATAWVTGASVSVLASTPSTGYVTSVSVGGVSADDDYELDVLVGGSVVATIGFKWGQTTLASDMPLVERLDVPVAFAAAVALAVQARSGTASASVYSVKFGCVV